MAIAAAWNALKVLPEAGALMLPTIPRPQWETCLQKNQIAMDWMRTLVCQDEVGKLTIRICDVNCELSACLQTRIETSAAVTGSREVSTWVREGRLGN